MKPHPDINTVKPDGTIICTRCLEWKDTSLFSFAKRMKRGFHSWCRDCVKELNLSIKESLTEEDREARRVHRRSTYNSTKNKAYREGRYEEIRAVERRSHFKQKYGITMEQYGEMYEGQGGKCAICSKALELVLDHDHVTGAVRGLLCNSCNWGLGQFGDDQELLTAAISYLQASV